MAQPAQQLSDEQPQTQSQRLLGQIENCLRLGCVIRIEHSPRVAPRFSPWQVWGTPACYNGDVRAILDAIEACRAQHDDHFVRLNIEDYSCHARFSFVVHSPA